MRKQTIPTGPFAANCTVLWKDGSDECWIVDPGEDAADIVAFMNEHQLRPALIALTHGHFDHINGVPALLERYPGLPVHIGPGDVPFVGNMMNGWPPDYEPIDRPTTLVGDLSEGFELTAAGLTAKVLSTPGHTPGSVCLLFEDEDGKLLISGDTLFAGSCGRTDFPGGSMAQMKASLARLAKLDPDTDVLPGHGGATTIAREVKLNPYIA